MTKKDLNILKDRNGSIEMSREKNKSLESINVRITHVAPWSSGSAKRVGRGSVFFDQQEQW